MPEHLWGLFQSLGEDGPEGREITCKYFGAWSRGSTVQWPGRGLLCWGVLVMVNFLNDAMLVHCFNTVVNR